MIIHKKPKFFWLLKLFFPQADWDGGVIITFKPWIFCKVNLSNALIAHEETHLDQQRNPYVWWFKYTLFPKFRLSQEIEAHRNEYRAVKGSRNEISRQLDIITTRLSSNLYKNLISKEEAIKLITQ